MSPGGPGGGGGGGQEQQTQAEFPPRKRSIPYGELDS